MIKTMEIEGLIKELKDPQEFWPCIPLEDENGKN